MSPKPFMCSNCGEEHIWGINEDGPRGDAMVVVGHCVTALIRKRDTLGAAIETAHNLAAVTREIEKKLLAFESALAAALECARVRGEALKAARPHIIGNRSRMCEAGEEPVGADDLRVLEAALALQPGSPALAEVVAAREGVERAASAWLDKRIRAQSAITGVPAGAIPAPYVKASIDGSLVAGKTLEEAVCRLAAAAAAYAAYAAAAAAARRKLGGGAPISDPRQCCERDHNFDGNCDRHPGKLRGK